MLQGVLAFAQNGVDNGGEYLALEFTRLGRDVFLALQAHPGLLTSDQLATFDTAIRETRVDAVNGPILDNSGREVDARVVFDQQYQEFVIEINRHTWPDIVVRRIHSHQLVFHEYMRVLQINDDNYVLSGQIAEEPYATYLSIKVPSVEGTQIWEQLKDYYEYSARPEWNRVASREFIGICFTKGDDVGRKKKFLFSVRSNGAILPPSKLLQIINWSSIHRMWEWSGEEMYTLTLSGTSLNSNNDQYMFRIFGETLVILHGTSFCFAE